MTNLQDAGNALLNQMMHASVTHDIHEMQVEGARQAQIVNQRRAEAMAKRQAEQDKKDKARKSQERKTRLTTRDTMHTLLDNDPNAFTDAPFNEASNKLYSAVGAKMKLSNLFKLQSQLLRSKAYIKAHGDTTDAIKQLNQIRENSMKAIDTNLAKDIANLKKEKK